MRLSNKQGFTLIELSIVLVIIGLIVGGVLVGQDLIKSAGRRSLLTDYEKIQSSINTFRGKYDCLPGDCKNATTIWGTETRGGGCPRDGNTITWAPADGTCNGNGNGVIETYSFDGTTNDEAYYFWQHLSLGGLWPGNYLGDFPTTAPYTTSFSSTTAMGNAPYSTSGFGNTGWSVTGSSGGSNPWGMYWVPGGITQLILGDYCGPNAENYCGGLTPTDAYLIDKKIDDGLSYTGGLVFGGGVGASSCVTLPTPYASGTYNNLTVNSPVCTLLFIIKVE